MNPKYKRPYRLAQITVAGTAYDVMLATYPNDRSAVYLAKNLAMDHRVTVNVPDAPLADDQLLVKTQDEMSDFREPLLACGVFEDTGERAEVGFLTLELWHWTAGAVPLSAT